jgi:putative methyltransferase (TIGR04325 family)
MEQQQTGYADLSITDLVVEKTARFFAGQNPDHFLERMRITISGLGRCSDNVLDFGGGAGITYLIARHHFPMRRFRWAIVDLPDMVQRARRFETDRLRFFTDHESAASWLGFIDLLYSNSAIQYVPDPEAMVRRLLALRPLSVHWHRVPLGEVRARETQNALLSEHGPGPIDLQGADRNIAHHFVRMCGADFEAMHEGYKMIERGTHWGWQLDHVP